MSLARVTYPGAGVADPRDMKMLIAPLVALPARPDSARLAELTRLSGPARDSLARLLARRA